MTMTKNEMIDFCENAPENYNLYSIIECMDDDTTASDMVADVIGILNQYRDDPENYGWGDDDEEFYEKVSLMVGIDE